MVNQTQVRLGRNLGQQSMRPAVAHVTSDEEDNNCSQEASQEDVFDEGEDVLNRRLPIVVNINGSIPNQRPSRAIQGQNVQIQDQDCQQQQQDLQEDSLDYQRDSLRQQRPTNQAVNLINEEQLRNQVNNYEEHKANEFGVQAPKYTKTKTSQKPDSSVRLQGENHMEDEQSVLRQADQPTIVKHHGQSRQYKMASHQQVLHVQHQESAARSLAA